MVRTTVQWLSILCLLRRCCWAGRRQTVASSCNSVLLPTANSCGYNQGFCPAWPADQSVLLLAFHDFTINCDRHCVSIKKRSWRIHPYVRVYTCMYCRYVHCTNSLTHIYIYYTCSNDRLFFFWCCFKSISPPLPLHVLILRVLLCARPFPHWHTPNLGPYSSRQRRCIYFKMPFCFCFVLLVLSGVVFGCFPPFGAAGGGEEK